MIAEFRVYTINRGMMDSYLELFNKQIVPNHKKHGIAIVGAWVNRQQNEIVWIRTFESHADRKAKLDVYESSDERDAVFPVAAHHMAKAEVKVYEDCFQPADDADPAVFETAVAKRAISEFFARSSREIEAEKAATAAPR